MMFADDIVICSESKEQVEEKLESWRYALERRGLKVNRRKTEYLCVNERQDNSSGTVKMQGEEVAKVEDFKYLGSTVQSNGECGRELKKRVQAGWNGWRRISGVICDRRVPARVKGKVYKVAVRPAMLYGLETVALTKRQEAEMEVAELKMLRFSLGVTRMDKIRNEYIRGTAQVGKFGEKTREARLRWYGHLRRKDDGYIGRRMLRMELPGKRKRGRPKRRFMDVVKEDMAEVEVTEEDTVDRRNWRKKIRCGDPWWEKPKEEEESLSAWVKYHYRILQTHRARTRTHAHTREHAHPTHDRRCSLYRCAQSVRHGWAHRFRCWRDNGRSVIHWNKEHAGDSVLMIGLGFFSRIKQILGRTETRTRDRICFQTIRSVWDIFRDDRARIATCSLRTTTDLMQIINRIMLYCLKF